MNNHLQKLLSQLKTPATFYSLKEIREVSHHYFVRDEHVESISQSIDHGIYIEAFYKGAFGYACTQSLNLSAIQSALDLAYTHAQISFKHLLHPFKSEEVRPAYIGEYTSVVNSRFSSRSSGEYIDRMIELSKILKDDSAIHSSQVKILGIEKNVHYVSSSGANITQQIDLIGHDLIAVAKRYDQIQERTSGRFFSNIKQNDSNPFFSKNLETEAIRIRSEAIELLDAIECPNEVRDLILAPDQLYLQIHESVGHPLEVDRILGDERNYAGWSFVKPEDFGSLQYGSKLMNITFDPTLPEECASYAYVGIGHQAQKEFIIKEGKLLRGLGSLESRVRSGIPEVACQRQTSWNRPPIDRMANINLEAGKSSFKEIIENTEKGVLMKGNRSWSIDDYRNKFQFGCEYGKLIEKGKITKTVKNPNYRGISTSFWNSLSMVGDSSTFEIWGAANCGKGEPNQLIRVGHASPICKFDNVQVFGGAK